MTLNEGVPADKKPLVTMWETYGSGMAEIAAKVAAAMGAEASQQAYSSEDLEVTEAEPERNTGLARILNLIAKGTPNPTGFARTGVVALEQRDNEELIAENTAFVEARAEKGGVLMGRNGTLILKDRPNTLHVKLDGPAEMRVSRAADVFRLSPEQATKRQRREDEVRSQMSIQLYGWDPRQNDHYDLVLNTVLLDADTCAKIILAAAQLKAEQA